MPVLVFGNRKGGVGKTTNSVMTAYELAKMGYKTLVCDLDPQSSATNLLSRTYARQKNPNKNDYIRELVCKAKEKGEIFTQEVAKKKIAEDYPKLEKKNLHIKKTMMLALSEKDIASTIVKVRKNLFLLPSDDDFVDYPDFLEQIFPSNVDNFKEKRIAYFGEQFKTIKDDYDFVVIDVPPTLSIYTDSAIYIADDVIVALQTQQDSFDGAIKFYDYMQKMFNKYNSLDFNVLGVLPVILHKGAGLDNQILEDAKNNFGNDAVFDTVITYMERIKRYGRLGIADKEAEFGGGKDRYDKAAHQIYHKLAKEIIQRLEEGNKE
ncbi:AAA family ATPase [Limosilactobacillus reuteri]|nr:AAA family ATPase [Limosilactobacillus reuteri]MCC4370507.1 AAA family ATPase [Limosilactobacillus reuteri]MCC4509438.1 AAA family ATPase [Limosilactobacillus reuteri]